VQPPNRHTGRTGGTDVAGHFGLRPWSSPWLASFSSSPSSSGADSSWVPAAVAAITGITGPAPVTHRCRRSTPRNWLQRPLSPPSTPIASSRVWPFSRTRTLFDLSELTSISVRQPWQRCGAARSRPNATIGPDQAPTLNAGARFHDK